MPETPENPQPQCHVHDKGDDREDWEDVFDGIREEVCVPADEYPFTEFEGKHYCLFHLPTKDKDIEKFNKIFLSRLKAVETRIAEAEKLSEKEQPQTKEEIFYDFRYVWFPSDVVLRNYKFSATTIFWSATFSADADFFSATFLAEASFFSASFSADAYFKSATFSAGADFSSATFSAGANFIWATFSGAAYFGSTTFSADADFSLATFSGETRFDRTKFGKTGRTVFKKASFAKDTFFHRTRFRNDASFNSAVLSEDSDVFFRGAFVAGYAGFRYCTSEGYLRFSNLRQGEKNKFDFHEAAFEKANRVSFHTIDLCPNWFVNVDSRKFVFTDIFWRHLDWDFRNKNVYAEIDSMADTGAALQKKRIFEIAARQLAVNAEENNRYEEAAKFRYMAMETRRLEETKHFRASRLLMWLYKWTSGYGESWGRAALVLLFIWLGFGLVYWLFGSFQIETPLDVWQSLGYSSQVMLLQKPNPRPLSNLTFTLYVLETISAPLQAALLALAIRRKFMR